MIEWSLDGDYGLLGCEEMIFVKFNSFCCIIYIKKHYIKFNSTAIFHKKLIKHLKPKKHVQSFHYIECYFGWINQSKLIRFNNTAIKKMMFMIYDLFIWLYLNWCYSINIQFHVITNDYCLPFGSDSCCSFSCFSFSGWGR